MDVWLTCPPLTVPQALQAAFNLQPDVDPAEARSRWQDAHLNPDQRDFSTADHKFKEVANQVNNEINKVIQHCWCQFSWATNLTSSVSLLFVVSLLVRVSFLCSQHSFSALFFFICCCCFFLSVKELLFTSFSTSFINRVLWIELAVLASLLVVFCLWEECPAAVSSTSSKGCVFTWRCTCGYIVVYHHQCESGWISVVWNRAGRLLIEKKFRSITVIRWKPLYSIKHGENVRNNSQSESTFSCSASVYKLRKRGRNGKIKQT